MGKRVLLDIFGLSRYTNRSFIRQRSRKHFPFSSPSEPGRVKARRG